jgi:hypothetical protein
MASDERKRWYRSPAQPAGLLIAAWFLFRVLAWIHLSLFGIVTEGQTGLLPPGEFQEAGEKVPYFYQPEVHRDMPLQGWRHGIDYGGQRLTVVYSPILNSFHATTLKRLDSPMGLWRDETYVLVCLAYAAGIGFGFLVYILPKLLSKGGVGFNLMPGLERDDPMNPR